MWPLIHDQRGAATVELALVLPIFLAVVAMVMVTGFRMVYAGLAEHGARTVAREAGIRTTISPSSPYPDSSASSRLTLCGKGAPPVAGVTYNAATDCSIVKTPDVSTPAEGDIVEVTLTYRVTLIQTLVGWLPANVVNGLSVVSASAAVLRE